VDDYDKKMTLMTTQVMTLATLMFTMTTTKMTTMTMDCGCLATVTKGLSCVFVVKPSRGNNTDACESLVAFQMLNGKDCQLLAS
jgi:hypothetical protein